MQHAVKAFIHQSWQSVDPDRFPGPQPVSIERRHFIEFKKQPYVVCEKTDGVRHMLCSFEFEGKRTACLVNRAFSITPVSTMIPRGTILDGELVDLKAGGKPVFLIHDAVCVKGVDVRRDTLEQRLDAARALLKAVVKSTKDPFEIRVKTMIPLTRLSELPALESFPWETDGLVFTPVREPIRMGTHETLFKWKPRKRITIDFLVREGNALYVQDRGQEYLEARLHAGRTFPDGTIVECGYGELGWFVEKVRTDKTYPNNRRTYFRTLVNLREDIQFQEFLACT
jgi:mRNA capping enzyme, catalytic domain/mRNA capping enzyme, C-terminal domain